MLDIAPSHAAYKLMCILLLLLPIMKDETAKQYWLDLCQIKAYYVREVPGVICLFSSGLQYNIENNGH